MPNGQKKSNKSLVVFEDLIQDLTFYATPCAKDDDDDVL
jgi:hypothetical protein